MCELGFSHQCTFDGWGAGADLECKAQAVVEGLVNTSNMALNLAPFGRGRFAG
jgi:hypothetical protein